MGTEHFTQCSLPGLLPPLRPVRTLASINVNNCSWLGTSYTPPPSPAQKTRCLPSSRVGSVGPYTTKPVTNSTCTTKYFQRHLQWSFVYEFRLAYNSSSDFLSDGRPNSTLALLPTPLASARSTAIHHLSSLSHQRLVCVVFEGLKVWDNNPPILFSGKALHEQAPSSSIWIYSLHLSSPSKACQRCML